MYWMYKSKIDGILLKLPELKNYNISNTSYRLYYSSSSFCTPPQISLISQSIISLSPAYFYCRFDQPSLEVGLAWLLPKTTLSWSCDSACSAANMHVLPTRSRLSRLGLGKTGISATCCPGLVVGINHPHRWDGGTAVGYPSIPSIHPPGAKCSNI